MLTYIKAFSYALLVAYALTPVVRLLAVRIGAVDQPVARSMHTEPKPYLGGIAIYLAFVIAAVAFIGWNVPLVRGVVVGGGLILVFGAIDDVLRLSAKVKLLGQILAALVLVLGYGVRIEFVTNPFGGYYFLHQWAVPLSVFWVVAVVNVVNLADGLDGLAAGISSIASLTLLFVGLTQHSPLSTLLLTAALAGAALGFLPHNFNPAKIFMGDAGAMFLGYVLAALSVQGTLKSATGLALAIPVLALGLPIFDTAFAIVRRAANHQKVYEADRGHLHHRLMQLGLSHRDTVLVMYAISAWLGISAIAISEMRAVPAMLLVLAVTVTLIIAARKLGVLEIHPKSRQASQ
ncbi:MAG: glycosyltransferase family 4 protein [Symbiobacteriia bacterium]